MKSNNWLQSYSSRLIYGLLTLIMVGFWTSCSEDAPQAKKPSEEAAGLTVGPTSTSQSWTINVPLAVDAETTWSYDVTATVTWTGSTTTWTYVITGVNGTVNARNISHVSFLGLKDCFWNNVAGVEKSLTQEGNTGCLTDKNTLVYKVTPTTDSPNLTLTYTFNSALGVDASAGGFYIKSATACNNITIPGPSCEVLGISGTVKQSICEGVTSKENVPFAAQAVTAVQGSTTLSTTTSDAGTYSFGNVGGVWTVTVGDKSTTVNVGPSSQVADFFFENRPNASCAEIRGTVSRTDCNGTSSVTSATGPVTLSGTNVSLSTDAVNGAYTFSNVAPGEYTVTYAGQSHTVTVASTSGSNVSDFNVDLRPNGSCAAITLHVDKKECLNQTEVTSAYANAAVTGSLSGTTDASGNVTFSNVPDGIYYFTVDGVNFSAITVSGSQGSYSGSALVSKITTLCGGTVNPVCSLSQGYWFAKPQSTWGAGVTFGSYTYSKAEGVAIWNSSNKSGLKNAKAAFTQASAIKLSNVAASASVWSDVAIIDAYFASLPFKMTASNIPSDGKPGSLNAQAGAAAGRIGQWIDAHHCNEQ